MAMNVNELADLLEELKAQGHGEKSVMFGYDYGDHWHTSVAATLSTSELVFVKYSNYHSMHKVLDEDGNADGHGIQVILLS